MIFKLKNIGRFYNEAAIKINGITVLAGGNGTGKSTIGKALYCVYSSLYDCENKIIEERVRSIRRQLLRYGGSVSDRRGITVRSGKAFISDQIEDLLYMNDAELQRWIEGIVQTDDQETLDELVKKIRPIVSASDDDILNAIFRKYMDVEFNDQVGHVNHAGESSHIELKIKNNTISVEIGKDVRVKNFIPLVKELVYVDDPYVIDDMTATVTVLARKHRYDLIQKLRGQEAEHFSVVDDVIMEDKLKAIYSILENICGGSVKEKDDEYFYTDKNLKSGISVLNLSTGMKCFVVLKTLLQKGYLEENGIVVLDEPEAHLHPEWMLLYAKIVALLQKELDINFIISTHSSEFLSYLELYSRQYGLTDKCNYYLLKEDATDTSSTEISDCTDNLERIYDTLTRPFIWVSRELDSES